MHILIIESFGDGPDVEDAGSRFYHVQFETAKAAQIARDLVSKSDAVRRTILVNDGADH